MVHFISPLQCPNQQEVSPEFPSQEISCEEALTAQTKSSSASPATEIAEAAEAAWTEGVGETGVEDGRGLRREQHGKK